MMPLILSRRKGEAIHLDVAGGIVITVQDIKGGQVRLTINAPRDVHIDRIGGTADCQQEAPDEPE